MKMLSRRDYSSKTNSRTVYTVEMENGKQISVMRKRYPEMETAPMWYVLDPMSMLPNDKGVIAFVKQHAPERDTMMPTLIRRYKESYADIKDTFFCYEQGMEQAEKIWEALKNKERVVCFELRNKNKLLKSWV